MAANGRSSTGRKGGTGRKKGDMAIGNAVRKRTIGFWETRYIASVPIAVENFEWNSQKDIRVHCHDT